MLILKIQNITLILLIQYINFNIKISMLVETLGKLPLKK